MLHASRLAVKKSFNDGWGLMKTKILEGWGPMKGTLKKEIESRSLAQQFGEISLNLCIRVLATLAHI